MAYSRQQHRFATAASIDHLSAVLGLPEYGQDWEIETADACRVSEFVTCYDLQQLDEDERFALMSLIVASFDELLFGEEAPGFKWWIVAHLQAEFDVHEYTVHYWAVPDEDDPEGYFRFTPIARRIMEAIYGNREHWPRSPYAIRRFCERVPGSDFLNSVDIADNRDGTFDLSWSKIPGRSGGHREFPYLSAAMKFADNKLGICPDLFLAVS
ncbi:MAG: hypothetical protein AAGC44_12685 [Planctomycetota bacterium]